MLHWAEIAEAVPETEEPPICPACHHGYGSLLGKLGNLEWFRCAACGMDFNRRGETTRIPDDLD